VCRFYYTSGILALRFSFAIVDAGRDVIELCCNSEAGHSGNQYFKNCVIISQNPISIYITRKCLLMMFRNVVEGFY